MSEHNKDDAGQQLSFDQAVYLNVIGFVKDNLVDGSALDARNYLAILTIKGKADSLIIDTIIDKEVVKKFRKSAFGLGITSETGELSSSVRKILQDMFDDPENKPIYDEMKEQLAAIDKKRGDRGI